MIEHCDLNIRYKQFILFLYAMSHTKQLKLTETGEEVAFDVEILTEVSFFSETAVVVVVSVLVHRDYRWRGKCYCHQLNPQMKVQQV